MMTILSEPTPGGAVTPAPLTDTLTPTELAATELVLPKDLCGELEMLVEASYPFEACGVMIGRADRCLVVVEDVFHARNLNTERARDRFLLDPLDHLAADRVARARGIEVVGFWHSHPNHPARPSETDRREAWEGYSYLIISTPAVGNNDFRSWRLDGGRFFEEKVRQISSEARS